MRQGAIAEEAVRAALERFGAKFGPMKGGAIAIDREGRYGLGRSTVTMSWAAISDAAGEAAGI